MKIITWNVNRFNGTSQCDIWMEARKRYLKEVYKYIEEQQIGKDDIVLLQEVPSDMEWQDVIKENYEILSWYDDNEKFIHDKSDIDKSDIDITIENRNSRFRSQTIAIVSKESNWELKKFNEAINFEKEGDKFNYVNKYVQLIYEKIELLGIHMPVRNTVKDKPDLGIEDLVNAFNNANCIPHIIMGDLNAGDYEKEDECRDFQENRNNYNEFVKKYGYEDAIKNVKTTNYHTPTEIDHVLIKKDSIYKDSSYILEMQKVDYKELSDHYPIIVNMKKY